MAEPLRALLSPGVSSHPYASAGWQRWLRGELAARARKVRWPGGSGLDCVDELTALCLADPEFLPITPGHTWDHPERLVDAMLGEWHFSQRVTLFNTAALSLAGRDVEVPAEWHTRDPSFQVYRAFLRACRSNTARYLAEHDIAAAWLWRGENKAADAPWAPEPLTFWTPIAMLGWHFSRWDRIGRTAGGRLILARIPAERIVSCGGWGVSQPHLGEVIVDGLGGPLSGTAWPVPGPELRLADPDDGDLEPLLLGGAADPWWQTLAERYDARHPPHLFRPLG